MTLSPDDFGTPTVEIERVAHGGHFVARLDGRVVFVRHALPGETVRIRVTEVNRKFLRADAIEVVTRSPDRVEPPCRYSRECGGCDFQHVRTTAQLDLLSDVVNEQLARIARLEWPAVRVEAVEPNLGWRTRVDWTIDADGKPGFLQARSHRVVPIDECIIAHPAIPRPESGEPGDRYRAVVTSTGQRALAKHEAESVSEESLIEVVHGRQFHVHPRGFWQVHPQAASTLVDTVLKFAEPRTGDTVFDLYSGVGLFTKFLADEIGPTGKIHAIEGSKEAHRSATKNVANDSRIKLHRGDVVRLLREDRRIPNKANVVILDPPRSGAKDAISPVVQRNPRTIVHIGCDPAAFARDLRLYLDHGWKLKEIRAFALFPMTHHVECVARLTKT